MEEIKILKHFTKFILPFKFSKPTKELDSFFAESRKGKRKYIFHKASQNSFNLRQGLDEMLLVDGGNTKIADIFELNNECRNIFELPKRSRDALSFYCRGEKDNIKYQVYLSTVRLFLFESGVGFFETEISYESDRIDSFIDCNYFISELKSEKNYFETTIQEYDAEAQTKSEKVVNFTLVDLANKVLAYVQDSSGFCTVDLNVRNLEKALFYSYVYLNRKPDNIDGLLFNMRKNYKGSYKFPNRSTNEQNMYVKQQFENSYWGASFNGAVNLSFVIGDEKTDSFFEKNFYALMHQTYYTLFIHVIHQRYSLLNFIGSMGDLDKLTMDYDIMKKQLKKARACKADASNLKFRAFFRQPSMIDHINDYYSLLLRTFRIGELYTNFTNDLENLENICDVYVTRIKERDKQFEKRRKIKIEVFVAIFGTLVGSVSLFSDYWDLLEKITGKAVGFFSIQLLVFGGLLLLPIVTSLVDVYYRIKESRKITDDLEQDLKDGLVEDDKKRKQKKKYFDQLNDKY